MTIGSRTNKELIETLSPAPLDPEERALLDTAREAIAAKRPNPNGLLRKLREMASKYRTSKLRRCPNHPPNQLDGEQFAGRLTVAANELPPDGDAEAGAAAYDAMQIDARRALALRPARRSW